MRAVLAEGENYGRSMQGGWQKVQIEFVSANPTGPLHVGHGRGAAYGASLSNLLTFASWDVTREYYVNDAGRQMDILGLSTWLRYLDQHGVNVPFLPNAYPVSYTHLDVYKRQPRGLVFEHYLVEAETAGDRGDFEQAEKTHGSGRAGLAGQKRGSSMLTRHRCLRPRAF